MSKKYCSGLSVEGVYSQRGYPMAKIKDYDKSYYCLISELIADFNGSMARMADHGIIAVGERAAYIKSAIADLEFRDNDIVYDSCGWNNGAFVDGSRNIYLPDGTRPGYSAFAAPVERYHARGDLDAFLETVAGPLAGHSVAEFAFSLMLAGPIAAFTGQTTNPGFAIVGDPEGGKSMLLFAAASVCGPPTSNNTGDGYPLTFSGTANGIEEEMQNYSDMTMILDEAAVFGFGMTESQHGRAMINVLMNLAQGKEKKRRKEKPRRFSFAYVISSNDTPLETIGTSASKGVIDAVNSRINTIDLRGRQYGVLDFLPRGYSDKADFLGGILAAAELNHGLAMSQFLDGVVKLLAKNPKRFKARVRDHLETFREVATLGYPVWASRRVLDAFGLVYVAGRLAQHLRVLPATFSPLESTLACYRLHLSSSLPPPRPVDIVAALLDDPEISRLDRGERLDISEEQFRAAKGFKVSTIRYDELIMSPNAAERLFDGWTRIYKHDPDIRRIMKRESNRPTTYRRIREGGRDRAVVFRIKLDWPYRRDGRPSGN